MAKIVNGAQPTTRTCDLCRGMKESRICPDCNGDGVYLFRMEWNDCPRCGGEGTVPSHVCHLCKGHGTLRVLPRYRRCYACKGEQKRNVPKKCVVCGGFGRLSVYHHRRKVKARPKKAA